MSAEKKADKPSRDYRIKGGLWASAWKIAAVVGAIGVAAALYGMASDPKRFAFSYLFAFMTFLTLGFGAMFFVLGQHLTGANWGVSVRRTAEFFMSGLPIMAILFVPVFLSRNELFPWLQENATHQEAAEHGEPAATAEATHQAPAPREAASESAAEHPMSAADARAEEIEHHEEARLLHEKRPYLNFWFFLIRIILYFGLWTFVSLRLFGWSKQQDTTKDPSLTKRMEGFSPAATMIFALTLTFAGFDWLMSLNPYWYSTIFGVWVFACGAVTIHAVLALTTMSLRASGHLGEAVNTEHFHDLGKLTFGFLVFWAYITFAQFFLIWYASIPEETVYYHARWGDGPWRYVSLGLIFGHFVLPFLLLLSRNVKRQVSGLTLGCIVVVVMHVVDMYWAVMPNYVPHAGMQRGDVLQIHWMDLASLLGVGGIYLAWVFRQMAMHPLIPVGDPRLQRSLAFENA